MKKILTLTMIALSMIGQDIYAAKQHSEKTTKTSKNKTAKSTTKTNTKTATTPAATAHTATPAPTPVAVVRPLMPMNCFYKFSTTEPVSDTELAQWGQYAARRSFDYNFDKLDAQLQTLKPCFTDKGWTGFNDALKQSGNLLTIKAQKLNVSSRVTGKSEVNLVKENQWRITVPLSVVYQNAQEKLTQSLSVVMVVTKKSSTELGIVQIIATPKLENAPAQTKKS
ncbi:MAG: DotI/IcmL family type IV secretion protein [Gammaproteobacteria bacterium]|nr:DotI/IcmL family type IV secretion protein [Gammaproteobacteria bacterium]